LSTLNVLFNSGVSPTIIAKAMTESVHSSTGKKGAFLAQTIANIGCQERKTMDEISGIKPHWSQAEKSSKSLIGKYVLHDSVFSLIAHVFNLFMTISY